MPEFVKLFTRFREHKLYPKDYTFSDYEAWLDLLIECYDTGDTTLDASFLGMQWGWDETRTKEFLLALVRMKFIEWTEKKIRIISKDWFGGEDERIVEGKARAQEVIDQFNLILDRQLGVTPYRQKIILQRLRDGRTTKPPVGLEQFKAVFEYKKKEWQGTDQERYLELETLCAAKHFFKYLDQAREHYRNKKKLPQP